MPLADQLVESLRDPVWVGVGSIATALAFIVALTAIVLDRRERTADERSEQASRVSAWIDLTVPTQDDYGQELPGYSTTTIVNSSDEPVCRLIAWLVIYPGGPATGEEAARSHARGGDGPATVLVVPPGRFSVVLPEFAPGMMKRPAVEIAFTDAAGRSWIRRQTGRLDPIKSGSAEHYGLGEPLDWGTARRA